MSQMISKTGVVLAMIFLLIVAFFIVMIPFSIGFSWLFVGLLSTPWNGIISRMFDLQYGEMDVPAVAPGILINTIILYAIGYGIERLFRQKKDSSI